MRYAVIVLLAIIGAGLYIASENTSGPVSNATFAGSVIAALAALICGYRVLLAIADTPGPDPVDTVGCNRGGHGHNG